jgi:4-hydroxy-2-oxoglutarate aldolase
MMKLEGIYAPIPTPFEAGGEEIAAEKLADNLRVWAKSSLTGLVLCGSNGELPFIETDERALVTRTARETLSACRSGKKIIVGAFMNSTMGTIECCKRVADAGADAVLLLPPHYFKGDGMPGAIKFFEAAADASPIPVVLYNMPGNTGVGLDVDTILHLSRHPNVIGIKDTSGDITQMAYLCAAQREDFSVFTGSGNYFLPSLALGASGGTLAVSNLYPEACRALFNLFAEKKTEEARALQYRVLIASDALTRKFGVPGLKAAMDRAGMYGGPSRAPLLPLGGDKRQKLFKMLDEANLDCFETWRS